MLDLKKLEHLNVGYAKDWQDLAKINTGIPVLEQIKRGSNQPCVFLPFMGEFGFFINTFIRFVHYFKCPKKIVCCRHGEEIFFPSADEFIYDWDDFQKDEKRLGANIPQGDAKYKKLKQDFHKRYPHHQLIEVGHEISYRFVQFMPIPLDPFCEEIDVDVVIGPRNRGRDSQRNYPRDKWQKIIDSLKEYKVGIVGHPDTTFDFPEVAVRNWEYERPLDALVTMLKNCRLFISTDTGTSHIAAMCGCPMLIFRKKDWSTDFVPFMKQQNNDNLLFLHDGWENEQSIIEEAHHFLNANSDRIASSFEMKKTCLHIPLYIETAQHRKMFLERRQLFKDLTKLDIDVVFTVDKCDANIDFSDVPMIDLRPEGNPTGIVRPTKRAIQYFKKRYGNECFMMRCGQDVKIDIEGIYNHVRYLQLQKSLKDKFIAGNFDKHNDFFGELKEIGINEKPRVYQFIQGNFMSAPMAVWDKYYNGLPPSVIHYKDDSVMSFCLERDGGKLEKIDRFWSHDPKGYFDSQVLKGETVESLYAQTKKSHSDVKGLLDVYEKYAAQCDRIAEFRDGNYVTTLCLANSNPKYFECYNTNNISLLHELREGLKDTEFIFRTKDSLEAEISEVDLLHLDTWHNYDRVGKELERHHSKVSKYILIHDTETFGIVGDDGKNPGLQQAISDFTSKHNEWKIIEKHKHSHGLIVLGKNIDICEKSAEPLSSSKSIKEHHKIMHRGETHKAQIRREINGFFEKFCKGKGIDIGCGKDPITENVDTWDIKDGDAQYMNGVKDDLYDFVYSSHCLEHMNSAKIAIQNWWRILKPGGYLIVSVPHRDLYEKKKNLPSQWNRDHKRFFLPLNDELPDTVGLKLLFENTIKSNYVIEYIKVCDDEFVFNGPKDHSSGEYSIELVVRKVLPEQNDKTLNIIENEPNLSPDVLVLYRFHSTSIDHEKFSFLENFNNLFLPFVQKFNLTFSSHLIVDDSPQIIIDMLNQKFGDFFSIIETHSSKCEKKLVSGKLCKNRNYYTFYLDSMEIAKELASKDTVVFFCEDDYLYRPDAFEKSYLFIKDHPSDFVTLYDHPDRYIESNIKSEYQFINNIYQNEIIWEQDHHWRTCISTCLTFVATGQSLSLNSHLFVDAQNPLTDHQMWCDMWSNNKSKLYSALPGLASHRRGLKLNDWDWESI